MAEDMEEQKQPEKIDQDEFLIEAKNFLNSYRKEIGESIKKSEKIVQIDSQALSEFSPTLAEKAILRPQETFELLQVALEELGLVQNARVRLSSISDSQKIAIRNIRAKHLNTLISIEGIVRQTSDVRPQVINAKFECPSCGTIISVLQVGERFKEPTRCSCGRRGGFRELSKEMVDAQRVVIEESPDSLEGGEQPKRMAVFLQEDLVDPKMEERTTPGSRVQVIGILKEVSLPLQTGIKTRFELSIEANNIIPLEESFDEILVSEEDEREIKELAADPLIIEKITKSIAPSVWGYPEIKQALAMQLFGGVKKVRSDGTKTRGDLHILLVGDPGVAKSVMLKYISGIAPKGRYVSGKSATGAGLTATVIKDEFMRGWALEAGAMVLSNKGLVCIDELEKMDENDRSTMHEALEQQTVTVSKANVQATLRAETAVLAAANPKFGRFDPMEMVAKQVNLEPPLLNRFDVIFILRDLPSRERDSSIARHVLSEHKQNTHHEIIEKSLLRKYIAYTRQRIKPVLSQEAMDEIEKFYVDLRNSQTSTGESYVKPIAISARQLEALIRMSEAMAKIKLSKKVTREDAKRAIDLMKYYLMHVGFDYETKTFDIDKIGGNPASARNKIMMIKDTLEHLEARLGKLIPLEELQKEIGEKMKASEFDEAMEKLKKAGEIFMPRKGFVQRM